MNPLPASPFQARANVRRGARHFLNDARGFLPALLGWLAVLCISVQAREEKLKPTASPPPTGTALLIPLRPPAVDERLLSDLSETYAFCFSQRRTLAHIGKSFPELAPQLERARKQWRDFFEGTEMMAAKRLSGFFNGTWEKKREEMESAAVMAVDTFNAGMTSSSAERYLSSVERRGTGDLVSPAKEMLLASYVVYRDYPPGEIQDGYSVTYSTKNHPRAGGLDLSVKIPMSWKAAEVPDNPKGALTQIWVSDGGHGRSALMLVVKDWGSQPTAQEIDETYLRRKWAEKLMGAACTINEFNRGKLDGVPWGTVTNTQIVTQGEASAEIRGVTHYLLYEGKVILLQLYTYPLEGEKVPDDRVRRMNGLLYAVLQTVVVRPSSTP